MSLGLAIIVLLAAFDGSARARGGLTMKPARPFTKQEMILIEQCRRLATLQNTESAAFTRQCETVLPYIRY
jgi:hypothetical protein